VSALTKSELVAEAKRISELGCSDGYCKFRGPAKGQHTNGGCRCTAMPDGVRRPHPYDDFRYMATILGLLALEVEVDG
jgi:hypothetical protein